MSGSGGSSGGGQSGAVDYPDYMKTFHNDMLNSGGVDTVTSSMVDLIITAIANNPFTGESAYNPATPISTMYVVVAELSNTISALSPESDWTSFIGTAVAYIDANIVDDTYINADIAAWSTVQNDERDNVIIPKFQAGMRDINAVMTSSFVVGEAIIEAFGARDAAKYGTELRMKLNLQRNEMIMKSVDAMLNALLTKADLTKAVAHYTIEALRLAIVSTKEQVDQDLSIDEHEAKWSLDMMMYGGNMLASIAGASTVKSGDSAGSRTKSMLGGALSGAAMGAAMSPESPWMGAGIGAILGAGVSMI